MAENKKSFILYADLIHTINKLPDHKAGELFKFILEYVNDNDPQTEDLLLQISFEPIKQQLKRDLVKWVDFCEKQRGNGLKGGRPKKTKPSTKKPKNPSLILETQKSLNDNDNVTDNDNENENTLNTNVEQVPLYSQIVEFWLKEFRIGWTFTAIHGKAIKSIITKIKKIIKDTLKEPTDELILATFKKLCHSLPEWYQNKDLQVIDSKFNEIITEIQNHGKPTPKTTESIFRKS